MLDMSFCGFVKNSAHDTYSNIGMSFKTVLTFAGIVTGQVNAVRVCSTSSSLVTFVYI